MHGQTSFMNSGKVNNVASILKRRKYKNVVFFISLKVSIFSPLKISTHTIVMFFLLGYTKWLYCYVCLVGYTKWL